MIWKYPKGINRMFRRNYTKGFYAKIKTAIILIVQYLLQNKCGLHYVTVVFLIYKNDVDGTTYMFKHLV